MSFGLVFMQPPSNKPGIPFKNVYSPVDTTGTDHRDNEVCGMNEDHRKEWREWQEEHQ